MFLVFLVFFTEFSLLGLKIKFLKDNILLIGLIEAVSGVPHDHIQELLKHVTLEVTLEILSVNFVNPE